MKQQFYKRVFAKPQQYKGIEFRSTLEKDFAQFLDGNVINYKGEYLYHNSVKWEYESKEFELIPQEHYIDKTERDYTVKTIKRHKKHTLQRVIYTPDFYLPDYNLLVEIKGKQFDDGLFALRFRMFKHKFPELPIVVIRHHSEFNKLHEILENLEIGEKE